MIFDRAQGVADHDVVSQTLAKVPSAAIPSERDRAEEHLYPSKYRESLTDDAMSAHGIWTQCTLVDVQLEVNPEGKLGKDRNEENGAKFFVCRRKKLAALMGMSEEVTSKSQCISCALRSESGYK